MPQGAYILIAKRVMSVGSYNKCTLEIYHRGRSDCLVGQTSENNFLWPRQTVYYNLANTSRTKFPLLGA